MAIDWNEMQLGSNERTSQTLARRIKELIFSGRLQQNEKLPPERELAKILGTSRTSIREAVLSLEQSGLIKIQRGNRGGFFVSEPSDETIAESLNDQLRLGRVDIGALTDARIIIEPATARLAAQRRNEDDLTEIEQSVASYRLRVNKGAERSFSDFDFHLAVARASGNLVMVMMISSLMDLLYETASRYSLPRPQREEVIDNHQRIFEAIRDQDAELAYDEMERHVLHMIDLWQDHVNLRRG